jgi:hypothetical protein
MSKHESAEQIWACIRKASLLKHISYGGRRLPRYKTAKLLPEIMYISRLFAPKSIIQWTDRMLQHNALLRRGVRMRLHKRHGTTKLVHCSLDLFMLQMHSHEVAEALDSLSTFGERVLPIIERHPESDDWWLSPELLIDRRRWAQLSCRVMSLVHLLGIDCDDTAFETLPLSPWPDLTKLVAAVRRARGVFGDFADPGSREQRTLRQIYWPPNP